MDAMLTRAGGRVDSPKYCEGRLESQNRYITSRTNHVSLPPLALEA